MDAWNDPPVLLPSPPVLDAVLELKRQLLAHTPATPAIPLDSPPDPALAPPAETAPETPAAPPNGDADTSAEALFSAIAAADVVAAEALLARAPASAFHKGYSALSFAVALDSPAAEALLAHGADPNVADTCQPQYTPLMWAVRLSNLPMVELLVEHGADPDTPHEGSASALLPAAAPAVSDFFNSHFRKSPPADIYELNTFTPETYEDDLSHQIRMSALTAVSEPSETDDDWDEEAQLSADADLVQTPEFDYAKVLPGQYIKFSDSDIPSLVDYIFGLRARAASTHDTKLPAAIVYQLVRYAHNKVGSRDLTEFLMDCFIARLRSVTNTKSGVFSMGASDAKDRKKGAAGGAGDIVLLSYWLSVIQFLHFYFAKGDVYAAYPSLLQELINATQSMIATLSFAINSRLNLLIDDCLLEYTNLVDASSVLYAKNWNLFKTQKKHPSSYDDILAMLYPPTQSELMKPSPVKYVQVLAALDYVLELHAVDDLLRVQTFSQVFYCMNALIFNRLMSTSRYCSRVRAIQIRLNLSAIEDWLRARKIRAHKSDSMGTLKTLLGSSEMELTSTLQDNGSKDDADSLLFYYRPLYHICKVHLSSTIELLQWLQVMSGIDDEEALINTINDLDSLNYHQLVKATTKLYRYEVDERKIPKTLLNLLKRLASEQQDFSSKKLHYMSHSRLLTKEDYIYLNPNYVFGCTLPTLSELIINYGVGLGGVRKLRSKKYQPTFSIAVSDDIDEILAENRQGDSYYDYESAAVEDPVTEKKADFKGDALFKEMQPPSTLAHKNWGEDDFESNPW